MKILSDWFERFFHDPQAVILTVVLVVGTSVVLVMGRDLAPVLAGIVIAYLLEGIVQILQCRLRTPRLLAVVVVFILFMAFVFFVLFGLLPLASRQLTQLIQQLPAMIIQGQNLLLSLPAMYPDFITEVQVLEVINAVRAEIGTWGQNILTWSLAAGMGFITLIVYLVLLPLLVFFFLKDKNLILDWVHGFLPHDHTLAQQVWREVDRQMGNYVRGKFLEILVVWVVTFATFAYMGLQFSMLLALMVGLSVIVPYIGAVVVTVPVALVAFFQWGWGSEFMWLLGVYLIIQGLDGNVLVPLLFSEVVDLHPIAIIVAVLMFGGLWGFWGVFFAIPLATVVQSLIKAWPRQTVAIVE
ncbi:MAG TPA: AI-2E family transporter [Candidatus Competibacteraceae bacterium]|nr:AI-2E family transporter [Candidatus Competibacteraceae bacterium]MCP5133615.1 AI-2E family transporter [Gammaproteobacteria bacterium]HPF59582.1 AI-2E family transporter [Candidatus Competibacteraceae bacterium]HRY18252.1 AI-2E family transporter [Candidatus Competibacteraceae bacterium]